jgi:uncharacterized membrane protein
MDPVDDPFNCKWGIFYYNKNDIRTVVPKTNRALGWTLNFARPVSYVFVALIIGSVILSFLLSK